MAGKQVEEIVIPWDPSVPFARAVSSQGVSPLSAFYAVPAMLLGIFLFPDVVPVWAKVLDGLLMVAWGGFCVWRSREVMATPVYREHAAALRLLLASPEYAGAYACLQGACDELKWVMEEKSKDSEGKPLVRRVYPTAVFVVEMEAVRRVLAWQPDPRCPQLSPPSLGQELRLRFDTSKPGMDSEKLRERAAKLGSNLGLNGYEVTMDLTRGETRHADVRIAQYPEGDLYARYGRQ